MSWRVMWRYWIAAFKVKAGGSGAWMPSSKQRTNSSDTLDQQHKKVEATFMLLFQRVSCIAIRCDRTVRRFNTKAKANQENKKIDQSRFEQPFCVNQQLHHQILSKPSSWVLLTLLFLQWFVFKFNIGVMNCSCVCLQCWRPLTKTFGRNCRCELSWCTGTYLTGWHQSWVGEADVGIVYWGRNEANFVFSK